MLKKNRIDETSQQHLYAVLKRAKCKRHSQIKLGGGQIFAVAKIDDEVSDILISSRLIIDLTHLKNYWIKNEEDQKWIENFTIQLSKRFASGERN